MADFAFWRDLETRFRALCDPDNDLRADWDYIVGSGGSGRWQLAGGLSPSARVRFKSLATQAGTAIADQPNSDSLVAWLEALRLGSGNFELDLYYVEQHADGGDGAHHQTGRIWRLCEASADYCAELTSHAFQKEANSAPLQSAFGLTVRGAAEQTAESPPLKSRRGRKKGTGSQETRELNTAIREAKREGHRTKFDILNYLVRKESLMRVPLVAGWRNNYGVKSWQDVRSKAAKDAHFAGLCGKRFSKVKA